MGRSGSQPAETDGKGMLRILLMSVCVAFVAGCTPAPTALPPASAPSVLSPSPVGPTALTEPQWTPTPGIVLHGQVILADGSGLANVSICRSYASYPGTVVATTDRDGSFQAGFAFIPGDEMIAVWPLASGYTFDPPTYRWRHYYGLENRSLDFRAIPSPATAAPPAPCS